MAAQFETRQKELVPVARLQLLLILVEEEGSYACYTSLFSVLLGDS